MKPSRRGTRCNEESIIGKGFSVPDVDPPGRGVDLFHGLSPVKPYPQRAVEALWGDEHVFFPDLSGDVLREHDPGVSKGGLIREDRDPAFPILPAYLVDRRYAGRTVSNDDVVHETHGRHPLDRTVPRDETISWACVSASGMAGDTRSLPPERSGHVVRRTSVRDGLPQKGRDDPI